MNELYRRSLVTAYALLTPACALLAIFASPVLRICFGNRYPDAAPLVRVFCLASLAMPLSSITDAVANGAGWWRRACVAAVAGGIVGGLASLCLTPVLGASGAALGPVLGISCTAAVLVSLTWKRLGEGVAWRQSRAAAEPVGAAK